MNIKLKEISRDDLKVGDTVGIARTVNCGWLSRISYTGKATEKSAKKDISR